MARMHVPAVAFAFLLFIGAGLAGLLTFFVTRGTAAGWLWGLLVFLGALLMWVVVAVLRAHNQSRVEQP